MKKFFLVLFVLVAVVAPSMAVTPLEEDSIELTYVPNRFKDNWEISVQGGVTALFIGLNHQSLKDGDFSSVGYGGEITATKWFNPNFGGRFGWQAEYGKTLAVDGAEGLFDNYFHMDLMWNWSNQFGGYKANRMYNAIPYLHAGVYYNPTYNAMMAGGAGLLNRFRINDHWKLNIDLRGNITSSSKFGHQPADKPAGITGLLGAYVGVTYCFNEATWATKKSAGTHYKADLDKLQERYDALLAEEETYRAQAESLAQMTSETTPEQAIQQLVDTILASEEVLTKVGKMTVYYQINASTLEPSEKLHLATYISVIRQADPQNKLHYIVIGRADSKTGRLEYNQALAQRRAETLKKELMESGVKEENITVKSEVVNSGNVARDRASEVQFTK